MPLSDEQMSALLATPSKSAPMSDEQMSALIGAHSSDTPTSTLRSFSDNLANTASFGYAPQIVGGITKALSPSREDIDSSMGLRSDIAAKPDKKQIPYSPYLIGRDATSQTLSQENQEHPTASLAGSVTGAIGSGVVLPLPKALNASSIVGGVGKGAAIGAGYGAVANPGDVEGQIDPLQLDARKENAIHGAEVGAITGGVTQGVSKGLKAVSNSPEALQSSANAQSVKASGAMLKDFRAMEGAGRTDQIGKFALDNGLVKAGDTFEDVGAKADAFKKDAGSRLDDIYSQAKSAHVAANGEVPDNVGFNPVRDKAQILSKVQDQLGDQVGGKSAVTQVSNYLDELGEKYGDKVLDPKTANNIEGAVSKKVNFLRNPLSASPEGEQAFSTVRKIISDGVDNHIEYLGKEVDPKIAQKLAEANKDYGYSSQIADMAKDKANRVAANSKFGLLDTISAGSGAVAGTIAGEEMGGHPVEGGLLGLGAGVLSHFARGHGDAILASGLNRAGQAMRYGPSQAASLASRAINPNVVSRAITQGTVVNGQAPDNSAPQEMPQNQMTPLSNQQAPTQKRNPAMAPISPPMPTPIQQVPQVVPPSQPIPPKGGVDKWAMDGFHNLRGHVDDADRKLLDENKGKILLDPKMKNLLVTASNYDAGSKPLDDILKHLKNGLGEK